MQGLTAFLDMRRYKNWSDKISSWKYLTVWRPVLSVFPRAQSASFLLSSLTYYQGGWKSAAAALPDLIFVGVHGECPWQVPICSWQHQSWFYVEVILSRIETPYGLHWWSSGYDSRLSVREAWVLFLVRKLDLACGNKDLVHPSK